ncbi:Homocysteine S-methyltransferase 1 [Fusarium oxysporum f. sp. albedinis]|nr:Homocysteine S-methyltransferase 1 [Fusarium oxysporum f. sp. albedinis]
MGLKMPDAKKRQLEESKKDNVDGTPSNAAATKALPDISEIHLEGEETDVVPIYDGCNEIRRKINAHMKGKPVTKHRVEMTFIHPGDIPRDRDDRTTWFIGAA